jgi:hypothetical protein
MQKTNIFRGMEILMLVAALGLTACGGGGGGSTGSTSPSSTTSGGTGSGGGGGTPASSTYTLSWDAVTGASVTGYRVYYGTAPLTSQSPLGTVDTTVTSVDFSPGQYKIAAGTTLYMAVSSLGINGVESPISKTVSVVVQ